MSKEVRILFLEDVLADAELNERELRKGSIAYEGRRVETRDDFLRELDEFRPDIVLSDYGLPQFNGLEALRLLRARGCDTPFILITGSLTEEVAVEIMKAGASDYVIKTSLKRLPSAVRGALETTEARRGREEAAAELRRAHAELERRVEERTAELRAANEALSRRERELADFVENASIGLHWVDAEGMIKWANKTELELLGYEREEYVGHNITEFHADADVIEDILRRLTNKEELHSYEARLKCKDGSIRHVHINSNVWFEDGKFIHTRCFTRDVTERKLAEEELRRAHAELERRVEERTRELRATNEALRVSESHFQSAFEDAAIGMALVGLDGRWLQVNRVLCRIVGYAERELLAIDFQTITHPEDLDANLNALHRMLAGEIQTYQMEKRYLHKQGHAVWVLLNASLVRGEGGDPRHFITQIQDITERKFAEASLQRTLRELRDMKFALDQSSIVSVVDASHRINYVNEKFCEILEYPVEELLGRGYEIVCDDRHPAEQLKEMERTVAAGRVWKGELALRAKGGRRVWTDTTIVPFLDGDGRPYQYVSIRKDITERKRAQLDLDAERQLLDALVEQIPVGVLFRGNEGRYTRANPMAAEILGIERDRLVGMAVGEALGLIRPVDFQGNSVTDETSYSRRAIESRHPVEASQVSINTPDGNRRSLVISAAPVAVESGRATFGSVVVISDITEQEAVQEQLRQSQKMEAIGQLAGGVAHDFNNLLTAILGNTQLAQRKLAPEDPLRQRLAEVEKAGKRATSLTRQLLAFSRRQHLERRAVDLSDTIEDMMKMVRRIIGEDVDVRIEGAEGLPPVFADPAQVEQVLMNLCVNARDAMPAGGTLTVETHYIELDEAYCRRHAFARPGRYVEVCVSDTGTGMDAETRARIFEPFFTTKEVGKGTGLGLAMVYGIVKQHDGHVTVYSELGHGSVFKVYFPVADAPVKKETVSGQLPLPGGSETILVAEDEESLRGLAKDILEGLGYEVLLAEDGARAVELYEAERDRINLLLFDVVMPRMGGHAAYERIRALGNGIPAIFMTGYSTDTVQDRFVKSEGLIEKTGAALIQKPYGVESLGRKVREVLDAARRQRRN